jgi:N-acyl-D-amino-acid deacylase
MTAAGADFDVVLRHGRVVDGTGNPARFADVGIKDGKIAALGRIEPATGRDIDATGLIIAPGFIDVHTHAENIDRLPRAENFLRMGVTTIILGNCGGSEPDLGEFFRSLENSGISANVASLVGHNTIRRQVMGGSFLRPPTETELDEMRTRVRLAMEDGALGLSTGLIYLPGVFAKTEEIVALAEVAARHGGIYVSHMRDEGRKIDGALEELITIARSAGIRAHVSHLKLAGRPSWGRAEEVLSRIDAARDAGVDVTQDQYTYTASSTGISQLIPESAREGGRDAFRARIADPDQRGAIVSAMKAKLKERDERDYSYAMIAHYSQDPGLNGLNLREAAVRRNGSDTLDNQIDLILEIESQGGASGIFHGMNEDDLETFLRHPNTMVAADSSVRDFEQGRPHPRGYGNNARVLSRYVRELGVLRLEDAIRRMTSLPATTFGLKERGILREGAWADLVLFDPGEVQDHATFESPHHYATGFRLVMVNGVEVVQHDHHSGARPGRVLRKQ